MKKSKYSKDCSKIRKLMITKLKNISNKNKKIVELVIKYSNSENISLRSISTYFEITRPNDDWFFIQDFWHNKDRFDFSLPDHQVIGGVIVQSTINEKVSGKPSCNRINPESTNATNPTAIAVTLY